MRFRDLGVIPGTVPAGERNAITDVPGVRVGHTTLIQGEVICTGVTVILPHDKNLFLHKVPAAVYTINGFGKACGFEQIRELGRLETPIALTNTLNVGRVAVFGLARTGTVGHHGSGDFVIAFSTQNHSLHYSQEIYESFRRVNDSILDNLFAAVVESVEESVYNALIAAETMTGKQGNTLYALPHKILQAFLPK